MEASTVLQGDLLLVDMDGILNTVSDRLIVRVGPVEMTPSEGDFFVVVSKGPSNNQIPSGFLDPATIRIIHLADSFTLTNVGDTSGNFQLDPFGNQFSFCNGGDYCANGLFAY